MFNSEVGEAINVQLHNIALYRAQDSVKYTDIVSPFSRIYLISKGSGSIRIEGEKIFLEPGYMYLIPSYTFCTYEFSNDIQQYYIHFSTSIQGGLNIFDLFSYSNQVKAQTFDMYMIQKLLHLHPDIQLPAKDPNIYQKKEWMNSKVPYKSVSHYLESRGIMEQLLSRFIKSATVPAADPLAKSQLKPILRHIQNNLHHEISVESLSKMAYLSKDHFSRIFKKLTGYPPVEYIIKKRIEKAQFLLLTTSYSQSKIIEQTGFRSLSYFSKAFKKQTQLSPGQFRKQS